MAPPAAPVQAAHGSLLDATGDAANVGRSSSPGAAELATPVPASRFVRLSQKFQQYCNNLIKSKIWERFVLIMILGNCVTLALFDPRDRECKTASCQRLQIAVICFSAFAVLECIIRIVALGLKVYWADPWNRLDLLIVACGIIDFIPGAETSWLGAFRTTRVLRPLRFVNRFPSLRILVQLMLDIVPMLGSVAVMCMFVFASFGIMGVQLWKGVLRNGCYNDHGEMYRPALSNQFYICSLADDDGMNSCPPRPDLLHFNASSLDEYDHCIRRTSNYQGGAVSFDNIFLGIIAIFQVITLEDWSELMYAIQNGHSFWVWPYFVVLVIIGSWFAVNLALVVIATQFRVTKKRETMLMQDAGSTKQPRSVWAEFVLVVVSAVTCGKVRAAPDQAQDKPAAEFSEQEQQDFQMMREVFMLLDEDNDGTISVKELRMALHTLDSHLDKTELNELAESIDLDGDGFIDFDEFRNMMGYEQPARLEPQGARIISRPIPSDSAGTSAGEPCEQKPSKLRHIVQNVVASKWFTRVVIVCITINTVSMAAEHHGEPDELTQAVEITNAVFAFVFLIEVCMRIYSVGTLEYFLDGFNTADFIIVLLGVVEVFMDSSNFAVLRSFRLLRLFKLARYLRTMQKQLMVMLKTLDSVLTFLLLLFLFIFMFAVMGMHLFGGRTDHGDPDTAPRQNFDTFLWSVLTVFQVLTIEEWNVVAYHTMHSTNFYAILYFVVLIVVGTYTIVNLFVAIMVEGFATDPEAIARLKDAIEKARSMIKNMAPARSRSAAGSDVVKGDLVRSTAGSAVIDMTATTGRADNEPPALCCWRRLRRVHVKQSDNSMTSNASSVQPKKTRDLGLFNRVAGCIAALCAAVMSGLHKVQYSFQALCVYLMDSKPFHWFLFVVLCFDTVVMCLERPSISPDSDERRFINIVDIVCETIFTIELIVKTQALGVFNGPNAYTKDKWNVYDFTLVITSWAQIGIRLSKTRDPVALGFYQAFRLYRTFRPFRIVQRISSLRHTVHMLVISMRPIGNLLFIGIIFYVIFAIWGVQTFKGRFFYCTLEEVATDAPGPCTILGGVYDPTVGLCSRRPYSVRTRNDCAVAGGDFLRHRYNFDNVLEAMLTLFVISSRDSWAEVMRHGMDASGVEKHPKENSNPMAVLYFVTFLLIVGYFVISMFVGVIVENFQLSMPLSTEKNTEAEAESKMGDFHIPPTKPGRSREFCHWLVHHKHFELVLTILIVINVVIMACEHYNQSETTGRFIEYSNLAFTVLYVSEVAVKLWAVGLIEYFSQSWNRFDAFVAATSLVGSILDLTLGYKGSYRTLSVLRVARTIRVARVLKLLKWATGLADLLTTVWSSMPQVLNLGMLLLVFFVGTAALGIELFGRIKCSRDTPCNGISKHANFENAGMAMLTLFRIATGDNWVNIMRDAVAEGDSPLPAILYFTFFVIGAQFVLLNVVVAVLMKNLSAALQWVDISTGEVVPFKHGAIALDRNSEGHPRHANEPQPDHKQATAQASGLESGDGQPTADAEFAGNHSDPAAPPSPQERAKRQSPLQEAAGQAPRTPSEVEDARPKPQFSSFANEVQVANLIADLQQRTTKCDAAGTEPDRADSTIDESNRASRNKRALKASLHIVMAMVKLVNCKPAPPDPEETGVVRLAIKPRISVRGRPSLFGRMRSSVRHSTGPWSGTSPAEDASKSDTVHASIYNASRA